MNSWMNHTPDVGSITYHVDLQPSTSQMYYSCPLTFRKKTVRTYIHARTHAQRERERERETRERGRERKRNPVSDFTPTQVTQPCYCYHIHDLYRLTLRTNERVQRSMTQEANVSNRREKLSLSVSYFVFFKSLSNLSLHTFISAYSLRPDTK